MIDDEGNQLGVLTIEDALAIAAEKELDLVEISPDSKPPVCRLVDYGKYKYLQKKNTRKQKPSPIKEIKLRPHIGQHDLAVKMGRLKGFLQDGCKAKLRVMFRGREFVHQGNGFELISSIVQEVADLGKIDSPAKLEGRNIVAVLSPVKSPSSGGRSDSREVNNEDRGGGKKPEENIREGGAQL